jgi:hypothetical protein
MRVVTVPMPATICAECAADLASRHPTTERDSHVSVYCKHNQVGGIFIAILGRWRLEMPVDETAFEELLSHFVQIGRSLRGETPN